VERNTAAQSEVRARNGTNQEEKKKEDRPGNSGKKEHKQKENVEECSLLMNK